MFDFDFTQGVLFEDKGKSYVTIKQFSWLTGQKETGQYRVEVKMVMPSTASTVDKWVKFEPLFFARLEKL